MKKKSKTIDKPEVVSDRLGRVMGKDIRGRVEKNTLCKDCRK